MYANTHAHQKHPTNHLQQQNSALTKRQFFNDTTDTSKQSYMHTHTHAHTHTHIQRYAQTSRYAHTHWVQLDLTDHDYIKRL